MRVLVPWADIDAPPHVRLDVYDGVSAPPADLAGIGFYVVPYARPGGEALIARMPDLEVVQTLNAGYEELLPLIPPGITLCNGRGLHDASTAELALALILAAQRNMPTWVRNADARIWDRAFTRSLADSRVLIVGYGSIGSALGRRLAACEAEVVGVARTARPEQGVHGVSELSALLPTADVVVLVLPLTPETDGLFGSEQFALLPDDALVVNVGRGRVLDTSALLAQEGRIRAALDVTDPEPIPPDHPLWTYPGIIITPHIAGGSTAFHPRARQLVTAQLRRYAAGEPLANVVIGAR